MWIIPSVMEDKGPKMNWWSNEEEGGGSESQQYW